MFPVGSRVKCALGPTDTKPWFGLVTQVSDKGNVIWIQRVKLEAGKPDFETIDDTVYYQHELFWLDRKTGEWTQTIKQQKRLLEEWVEEKERKDGA